MQMQLQLQAQAQHDGQHTPTHAVRDSDFHRATKADRQTDAIRSVSFRFSIRPDPIRSVSNRKQTKAIPILTQNDPHFFFSWPTNCWRAKRSPSYGFQNDWQLARAFVIGFMLISDEICAMQLLLLLPLSLSVDSCCKLQLKTVLCA